MSNQFKIAVDGRNLTKPLSGINRYLSEILLALAKKSISIELHHHKPLHDVFASRLNVENICFRQVGTKFGFPKYEAGHETIFWGPAHRFPVNMPADRPAILTVHDLVWKKQADTMQKRTFFGEKIFFTRAVRRADMIVCVSQSTANDLSHLFPQEMEKIRVIHPGARDPSKRPSPSGKPFILFVGTLEPRKNLSRLIAAFHRLPTALRSGQKLFIVGSKGWGVADLQELVSSLGLEKNIRLISAATDDEINQLYADCAFLVMPSLYEGFGLPLLEAMKYGKPVITSNISSMPEVARSAGLLVDPYDTQSITDQMVNLLEDKNLYFQLANNAKEISEQFSWERTAMLFIDLFDELEKLKV